jgi:hypothetical protein
LAEEDKNIKTKKMNKTIKTLFIAILFSMVPLFIIAQGGPPDPGDGGPGSGDPPVGGSAPLDDGIIFLMGLAVSYGAKEVYHLRKKLKA